MSPFDQVAFTRGCQLAFWVTVGISLVGLIATLVLIHATSSRRRRKER